MEEEAEAVAGAETEKLTVAATGLTTMTEGEWDDHPVTQGLGQD